MNSTTFLTIGERKLSYTKTGSGKTLVIAIPGGPGLTHHYLKSIHEALPEDQYTVLSYSPSGTIGNEHAPFYKSIKGYADELKQIIDQLNFDKIILVGHSFSSTIVHEFLVHHTTPQLQAVVLINSYYSGAIIKKAIEQRLQELPEEFHTKRKECLAQGDGDALDALVGQYWFPAFVIRTGPLPHELMQSLAGFRDAAVNYYFSGPDFLKMSGALLQWDRSESLQHISCPVLIMSGSYDYISRGDFETYCNQIPNARRWYHEETSHFPMLERPEEFKHGLYEFLNLI